MLDGFKEDRRAEGSVAAIAAALAEENARNHPGITRVDFRVPVALSAPTCLGGPWLVSGLPATLDEVTCFSPEEEEGGWTVLFGSMDAESFKNLGEFDGW